MQNLIPEKYYKSGKHPIVSTVGELLKKLKELPIDLKIEGAFQNQIMMVVCNIKTNPVLTFEESEDAA